MYIGKFLTTFLQKDNCPLEAESPLKKTCLMHDVFARAFLSIRLVIFGCHHKESKCGTVQQLG